MHAEIVCPACRRSYAFTERVRGKTVRCPSCSTRFTVSAEGPPPPADEADIPQAVACAEEAPQEEIVYMAEEVPAAPEEATAVSGSVMAEDDDAGWVLPAETLPAPATVWTAVVALVLMLAGELVGAFLNYSTSPTSITMRLAISLPLCSLLLVGVWIGSRLAWFGCRILAPLAGGLQTLSIAALFIWLILAPAEALPQLPKNSSFNLSVLIAELGVLAILFLDLGQTSARRYFGLVCPACGSRRCRAEDFWFRRVCCRSCRYEWTAAQTARLGLVPNREEVPAGLRLDGAKARRRKRPATRPRSRSRRWVGIAAALLGVGLMAGLGYVAVTRLLPVFRQGIDAAAWRNVSPSGGNFKAEMPGTPKYTQQVQQVGADRLQVHTHEVLVPWPERSFSVSYSDYPDWVIQQRPVEVRLDGSRDGMLQAVGGKLRGEKRQTLDGFPGRELEIEIPGKGTVVVHLYAVNRRIFILAVGGAGLKPDSVEVRRFFDSFQLQGIRTPTPPAQANQPGQPRPHAPQSPPEPPPLPYVPTPIQPVVIKPPSLSADKVIVPLPGPVGDVAVGGGGRFLIFYLPSLHKVLIFDANEAKVVREIPVPAPHVFIAAGMDKLIVVDGQRRQVIRYSLRSFLQEAVAPLPLKYQLTDVMMGSASNGPLLVSTANFPRSTETFFFDIISMRKVAISGTEQVHVQGGMPVRASADGRVFCSFAHPLIGSYVLRGQEIRYFRAQARGGPAIPGPDGQVIFTPEGLFTNEMQPITRAVQYTLPAHHGHYFLSLQPDPSRTRVTLNLHLGQDFRPLVPLPEVDVGRIQLQDHRLCYEKRIHLIPDAHLLVNLPSSRNELVVHRFDLKTALEKAGTDYLVVTSLPPATAQRGATYSYPIRALAKRGGLKYCLEFGPKDMQVSPAGHITWPVPMNLPDAEGTVIVRITDGGGQERLHTFKIQTPFISGASPDRGGPGGPPRGTAFSSRTTLPGSPPQVVAVKPAVLDADKVVRQLPAPVTSVAPGGGGRFLILHLPQAHQLAVFDVHETKITRSISTAGEDVKFAAGMDRLLIVRPDSGILERWNLLTLEREAVVPMPVKGRVNGLLMGSASDGPLFLSYEEEGRPAQGSLGAFMDVHTLHLLNLRLAGQPRLPGLSPQQQVRISADGRVLGLWNTSVSPQGVKTLVRVGTELKQYYQHDTAGHVVPGPDGRVIFTFSKGLLSNEIKPWPGTPVGPRCLIPALQGNWYSAVATGQDSVRGSRRLPTPTAETVRKAGTSLTVGLVDEARPITTLTGIDLGTNPLQGAPLPIDQRIILLPFAQMLITIPTSNDRLVLYRFDTDQLLRKAGVDYLLAMSHPLLAVRKGLTYHNQLEAISNHGGIKYRLDSGPPGMTISDKGQVSWAVPADWSEAENAVIITLSDAGGREVFQTFTVQVVD